MKKIEISQNNKKLNLNKQTISRFSNDSPFLNPTPTGPPDGTAIVIVGHGGLLTTYLAYSLVLCTHGCDVPTIGHDDGPFCISTTGVMDYWCQYCYGRP